MYDRQSQLTMLVTALCRVEQRGIRLLGKRRSEVRYRILETGFWDHSSDRFGELCRTRDAYVGFISFPKRVVLLNLDV